MRHKFWLIMFGYMTCSLVVRLEGKVDGGLGFVITLWILTIFGMWISKEIH